MQQVILISLVVFLNSLAFAQSKKPYDLTGAPKIQLRTQASDIYNSLPWVKANKELTNSIAQKALTQPAIPTVSSNTISSSSPAIRAILRQGIPEQQTNKLLGYLNKYKSSLGNTKYATFIDFGMPSTEKRMFLVNLQSGEVNRYFVAHGQGSGKLYAEQFSNKDGSHKSSLGLYVVQGTYVGKHGTSLYLDGLEKSNSNARDRNIVIHAANYVSQKFINAMGYLGRSHGCPALNPNDFKAVLPKIKGGSLLLAFD